MCKIYLNGEFIPKKEAKVSLFDHGLLYGDGVFEGIRAYNGYVFKLEAHLDRLYESAHIMSIDIPLSKKEMEQKIIQCMSLNAYKEGYIRIIVTRGSGDLGISPENCDSPTVAIFAQPGNRAFKEEVYNEGLHAIVSTVRNQPAESLPPTVKTLNYATNILARIQARALNCQEAIMLDVRGNVSEGTVDNIFIVKDNSLLTPPTINNLPGITKRCIKKLARSEGYSCSEENFGISSLYTADEVFLTGTAVEVVPIVEIDGRAIDEGKPGTITNKMIEKYRSQTGIPDTGRYIGD